MAKEKIIGIYKITSPSGKIYIGQSLDIHYRWNVQYFKLKCKSQTKLYESFLEHGVENHTFETIHTLESSDSNKLKLKIELNKLEINYIKHFDCFDTNHGLNLTSGGDKNLIVSNETKKRLSESHLGQKAWNKGIKMPELSKKMSGENSPLFGKKGKDCHNFGKKRTPEQNKRQSESRMGNNKGVATWNKDIKYTEEQKINLRKPKKKRTEEHIKNNSLSNTGLKRSGQALLNIIEAQRKRRERELIDSTPKRKVTEEQKKMMEEIRNRNKEEKILNGTYIKRTISEEQRNKLNEAKRMIRQERLSMIF